MKTTSEKSTTTTPATTAKSEEPFFKKAGAGSEPFFNKIQTKLTVNKPGDKFEQEADKMADKVMRTTLPGREEKMQLAAPNKIQKKEEEKILRAELKEDKIQKADVKDDKIQRAPEEKILRAELKEEKIQKAEAKDEKIQRAPEEKVFRAELKEEKIQKAEVKDDKVLRKGDGTPAVASTTQSAIQNKTTGGQPLSNDVKSYMEPRFGADFSNVRVHTDQESAKLNNQLSARAFTYQNHVFFSRDQYQPGTGEGKHLLAHELTHTIQQGHAVQRSPQVSTSTSTPAVQRLGIQDARDKFAEWANVIPGFRMLTVIIGFNPVNMRTVDRSAANILRAFIEIAPGGSLITQVLDSHGLTNKMAAWLEQKMAAFADIGGEIVSALNQFLETLKWTDIFDLGGLWDRAKGILGGPASRLLSFAGSTVVEILKMVKDAILKPLAAMAQGTAGYDLLKAILGEDPISGEPASPDPDAILGGFMKLIGQEEIYKNLKQGNAIAKAAAWFQGALSGLLGFARAIPGKVIQTVSSFTFTDIVTIAGAFGKIVTNFSSIASEFMSWAFQQIVSLLEILFSVVAPGAVPYIKKAQGAFQTIIKNPIGFVGNLVAAGKLGFQMFASNIGTHLKNALIKWITGPLGEAGVYIPKSFSLMEVVKLVLSVLGLTWANIRSKLVRIIPEPVLVGIEKTAGILVTLANEGPAAAWEQIKAELSELKDQLIAQVTQMVTGEVVKVAVTKLASMINPAGAVIQAILAIYNTITFFIQKISQIGAVVGSFIDSISAIAAGQIAGAAKKVESTMASTLNIVIAFMAKFVGLGNIPEKLVGVVRKIRKPIDKGMDKIVAWLGKMLDKLTGKKKKDDVDAAFNAVGATVNAAKQAKKTKEQLQSDLNPLRSKFKFKKLIVVDGSKGIEVDAEINPAKIYRYAGQLRLKLIYDPSWPLDEFMNKATKIQAAANAGQLSTLPLSKETGKKKSTKEVRKGADKAFKETVRLFIVEEVPPAAQAQAMALLANLDPDHQVDLQLSGKDCAANISMTDGAMNKTMGFLEMGPALRSLPADTKIEAVTIDTSAAKKGAHKETGDASALRSLLLSHAKGGKKNAVYAWFKGLES